MKNAVNDRGESTKLFNFRPALFAAFFLTFGITFGYYRVLYKVSYLWLLLPAFSLLVPLAFSESGRDLLLRLGTMCLLAACFCLGTICFRSQLVAYQELAPYQGECVVLGVVESKKEDEESAKLLLKELVIDEKGREGRLLAYLPAYKAEGVKVGDKVLLRGRVTTDVTPVGEYGFKEYEITQNIAYRLTTEEECIRVERSKDFFLLTRARMEEVVYRGMDETPASLTLALLTGDVSGADSELMENMRVGGISHIFAVSGLNVGALYGCLLFIFSKTALKRTPSVVRFLLLVGVLFFYCGVCGFSASVVRAAITCATFYFAKLFGIGSDPLNSLGFAAILILLVSPAELFGVGFQLSFLACLGLFLLMKPTTQVFDEIAKVYLRLFPRRYTQEEEKLLKAGDTLPPTVGARVWRGAVASLSASVSAQLATIPALLIHFDYLSGWSLLLNFFFVPVTDGLFTLLLPLVGLACLLPTAFSTVLLYIPSLLWSTAILAFDWADFSTFRISGLQFSVALCVCYYGGILLLTDKLNLSARLRRGLAVAFWSAFALGVHLL